MIKSIRPGQRFGGNNIVVVTRVLPLSIAPGSLTVKDVYTYWEVVALFLRQACLIRCGTGNKYARRPVELKGTTKEYRMAEGNHLRCLSTAWSESDNDESINNIDDFSCSVSVERKSRTAPYSRVVCSDPSTASG